MSSCVLILTIEYLDMTTESKGQMIDGKLPTLIAVGTLLSLGHSADHAIRDDFRWPSLELIAFVIVSLVLYGAIGTGLYLYAKGKVGPRFGPSLRSRDCCSAGPRTLAPSRTSRLHTFCVRTIMVSPAGWRSACWWR